jgi:hypothetical protein
VFTVPQQQPQIICVRSLGVPTKAVPGFLTRPCIAHSPSLSLPWWPSPSPLPLTLAADATAAATTAVAAAAPTAAAAVATTAAIAAAAAPTAVAAVITTTAAAATTANATMQVPDGGVVVVSLDVQRNVKFNVNGREDAPVAYQVPTTTEVYHKHSNYNSST